MDQLMIARYVGHAFPTLAASVYSGGSTEQTSREVARRIKYSAKVEKALSGFTGRTLKGQRRGTEGGASVAVKAAAVEKLKYPAGIA